MPYGTIRPACFVIIGQKIHGAIESISINSATKAIDSQQTKEYSKSFSATQEYFSGFIGVIKITLTL